MSPPDFPLPYGYGWQYEVLRIIQRLPADVFSPIAHVLAVAGTERVYLLALPVVFWSVDRRFGVRLAYIFLLSMYTNNWIKDTVRVIRPEGIPGISTQFASTAPGYSMPSAHAQGALTFFGVIASALNSRWAWPVAVFLSLFVGLSRLYSGLHWPLDVVVGWVLGGAFALGGVAGSRWWTYRGLPVNAKLVASIGIPVVLLLIHRGPVSAEYAAWLLAMGVGLPLEERLIGSSIATTAWGRVCAAIIGIAGIALLQWMIPWPSVAGVWVIGRGLLVGLWCTVGAPWVFVQCGLYAMARRLSV